MTQFFLVLYVLRCNIYLSLTNVIFNRSFFLSNPRIDQNHLSPTSYYKDIILKECCDGTFMEAILHGKIIDENTHKKYGTYLFGPLNHKQIIHHSNGRFFRI